MNHWKRIYACMSIAITPKVYPNQPKDVNYIIHYPYEIKISNASMEKGAIIPRSQLCSTFVMAVN